ncbi:Rv3235 family protein [Frankia sp. R82]|uniref:Rv3235 family protein n=1 Tax=Frankia sp. R82 TaxID=2950553 RepID=UPI002043886A|nr:Rv3235 family protein [Frankia sp. R82]MCM3885664.1 Rv3235 family protein [Frankia sp. R82]
MTAARALPCPRRATSGSGLRLLPVTPSDPPFDDEPTRRPALGSAAGPTHAPADRTPRRLPRPDLVFTECGRPSSPFTGPDTTRAPAPGTGPAASARTTPSQATTSRASGRASASRTAGGRTARTATASAAVATAAGDGASRPADEAARPQPSPKIAAVIVVRAIVEALAGARPVSHLARWTTPRLLHDLERTAAQLTDRRRGRVRSVRVSEPRPGVAEVSAVISRGSRAGALALRMEAMDGRWRVTTLQVG